MCFMCSCRISLVTLYVHVHWTDIDCKGLSDNRSPAVMILAETNYVGGNYAQGHYFVKQCYSSAPKCIFGTALHCHYPLFYLKPGRLQCTSINFHSVNFTSSNSRRRIRRWKILYNLPQTWKDLQGQTLAISRPMKLSRKQSTFALPWHEVFISYRRNYIFTKIFRGILSKTAKFSLANLTKFTEQQLMVALEVAPSDNSKIHVTISNVYVLCHNVTLHAIIDNEILITLYSKSNINYLNPYSKIGVHYFVERTRPNSYTTDWINQMS